MSAVLPAADASRGAPSACCRRPPIRRRSAPTPSDPRPRAAARACSTSTRRSTMAASADAAARRSAHRQRRARRLRLRARRRARRRVSTALALCCGARLAALRRACYSRACRRSSSNAKAVVEARAGQSLLEVAEAAGVEIFRGMWPELHCRRHRLVPPLQGLGAWRVDCRRRCDWPARSRCATICSAHARRRAGDQPSLQTGAPAWKNALSNKKTEP